MKPLHWLIIFITAIAIIILLGRACNPNPPDVGYIKDSTQYYKNMYGHTIAALKQRDEDFNIVEKKYLDSISKIFNTKPKYIREVITVTTEGKTVLQPVDRPVITYTDTGKCPTMFFQAFENPYHIVEATIDIKGNQSKALVQSLDTITLVTKEVTEGLFFKKKRYIQIDVKNANPDVTISSINAYRIPVKPPKRFGIGIQAGYGLSTAEKVSPYIGIGVSYNLIRF